MLTPAILHLFGRQDGVASNQQLREHLSPRQIKRALDTGLFIKELPTVRRLVGTPSTPMSRMMALSLFADDRGFVSGMTAARAAGITCVPSTYFELLVPERLTPELPPWVSLTRSSWRLADDLLVMANGLRVSAPMRTLFRCAVTCSDVRFEKIAEQMWHRELITPDDAAGYLQIVRRRGRGGVARFERWLEGTSARTRPSQSGLEVDLAAALARVPIPTPCRQYPVTLLSGETIHLDLAWPDVRFGAEPGANWWHGGNQGTRRDRARDRACDEVGWRIEHFDEVELRDVDRCARDILKIYRSRLHLLAV